MLKFSGSAHLSSRLEHRAQLACHPNDLLDAQCPQCSSSCASEESHLHWNASELDKSRSDAQRKYTHMCDTAQHVRTAIHTEAGVLSGTPNSTRYVRVPAGSRNSAIHTAYHTLLCLSSVVEPGHPLLKLASTAGGPSRKTHCLRNT